jgi:Cytochrome bd terminal oxidase subunit II
MRAGDRWRRLVYVLLDGTDLGSGAVFLLFHDMSDRKQIISSILPIWDANETWIVIVAGGLIAMFSAASVALFSGLYLPVIAMLITLAGRGIALEFRDHRADDRSRDRNPAQPGPRRSFSPSFPTSMRTFKFPLSSSLAKTPVTPPAFSFRAVRTAAPTQVR